MRVSTLLAKSLTFPGPPPRERDIETNCPSCGLAQTAAEARVNDEDRWQTDYSCKRCDALILIVGTPGVISWKGRGYRLGDWSIRNPSELIVRVGASALSFPASPAALD